MLNYKLCLAPVPFYSGTAGGHKVDSGLKSSLGKTRSVSSSLKMKVKGVRFKTRSRSTHLHTPILIEVATVNHVS